MRVMTNTPRQPHPTDHRHVDFVDLSVLLACAIAVVLFVVSAFVEATPPYLVAFPILVAALTLYGMRRR